MSILFYDIETVSGYENLLEMKEKNITLYEERMNKKFPRYAEKNGIVIEELTEEEKLQISNDDYVVNSGLDSAFNRICCISVGLVNKGRFAVTSYYGWDEKQILVSFFEMLESNPQLILGGYNNKFFDNPTCIQRALKYGLKLPPQLNIYDLSPDGLIETKKPWTIKTLDLMESVRAGKQALSLNALCGHLGIPTPKDAVIRSDIYGLYYQEKDLEGVKEYCEKDVVALYQSYCKFLKLISNDGEEICETLFIESSPFN